MRKTTATPLPVMSPPRKHCTTNRNSERAAMWTETNPIYSARSDGCKAIQASPPRNHNLSCLFHRPCHPCHPSTLLFHPSRPCGFCPSRSPFRNYLCSLHVLHPSRNRRRSLHNLGPCHRIRRHHRHRRPPFHGLPRGNYQSHCFHPCGQNCLRPQSPDSSEEGPYRPYHPYLLSPRTPH